MNRKIISAFLAVFLAAPMCGVSAEAAPETALYYDFDSAAAPELKNGASTGEGKIGKGLVLDGEDDYALLPENVISDEMTVSAWIKQDRKNTWGRMFDFGDDSANNFFFAPYSGGASRVEAKAASGTDTMDSAELTETGVWAYYTVTADGNGMRLYRDGFLINEKKGASIKLSEIKNTLNYIGKSHYEGDAYFAGAIDDFAVYDRALSAREITETMSAHLDASDAPELLGVYTSKMSDGQLILSDRIDLPAFAAGKLALSWRSSNPAVIDTASGTVSPPDKAEEITLTASVSSGGEELCAKAFTVTVPAKGNAPFEVNIDASDRSRDVSDIMWGLFFEDINSAADGGLYAELVQNRSFEMEDPFYSWETNGAAYTGTSNPINENNPTYLTLAGNQTSGREPAGGAITNDGFQGMSIKKGETYDFSMYARGVHAEPSMISVTLNEQQIELESAGETENGWVKLAGAVTAQTSDDSAKLTIRNIPSSSVDVDMISLIPRDTYKGHGLRKDLMERLEAMHPKFLRFPGGCAVEGHTMDEAWNWKDTIGDVSERKEMINIWNPSASEPYMMTYGLGFYEYFQMCEDLGMEPVPILNCGMACQVRSGSAEDAAHLVPLEELQPYIDDALDLIAFANGTDETNEWTKKRIEMGASRTVRP